MRGAFTTAVYLRSAAAAIGADLTEAEDDILSRVDCHGRGVRASQHGARVTLWHALTTAAHTVENRAGIDCDDVMSAAAI